MDMEEKTKSMAGYGGRGYFARGEVLALPPFWLSPLFLTARLLLLLPPPWHLLCTSTTLKSFKMVISHECVPFSNAFLIHALAIL